MGTTKTVEKKVITIQGAIVGATVKALQVRPRSNPDAILWIPRKAIKGGQDLRSGRPEGNIELYEWWHQRIANLLTPKQGS